MKIKKNIFFLGLCYWEIIEIGDNGKKSWMKINKSRAIKKIEQNRENIESKTDGVKKGILNIYLYIYIYIYRFKKSDN